MKVKQKSTGLAQAMIEELKAEPAARRPRALGRRTPSVGHNVIELIEEEVRLERMDPEEALMGKVHALFEPSKLPQAMRAAAAVSKCTTSQLRRVVHELKEQYQKLSPKAKTEISKYIRLQKRGDTYLVEYPGRED